MYWRLSRGPNDTPAFNYERLARPNSALILVALIGAALLIVPATTSRSAGAYRANRFLYRRWIFLGAQIGLIIPIVFAACSTWAPLR
jgi:hypothetical protein